MPSEEKPPIEVKVVDVSPEVSTEIERTRNAIEAAKIQAAADVAAQVRATEAETAKQVRIEDAKTAARVARTHFAEIVILPIVLAVISGMVVAIPTSIAAWRQTYDIREIKKTGTETHTLVNSNMGLQLKVNVLALQRVADFSKEPEDYKALEDAKSLLKEHERKQKIVDESHK